VGVEGVKKMVVVSTEDCLHESDMLLVGRIQIMSLVGGLQPRHIRRTINIDVPEDCANRCGSRR
jgi:hypothetical protein